MVDTKIDKKIFIHKMIILSFVFLFFIVLSVLILSTIQYSDTLSRIKQKERKKVIISSHFAIANLQGVDEDIRFLSQCNYLRTFGNNVNDNKRVSIEQLFSSFLQSKDMYSSVRFIDTSGIERIRINSVDGVPTVVSIDELENKNKRYYFVEAIEFDLGDIYYSPLDLNVEDGEIQVPYKPSFRIATPVQNLNGENNGVVVLNYKAEEIFSIIKENFISIEKKTYSSDLYPSGIPLLMNYNGDFLIGKNQSEEWGFMFDNSFKIDEICKDAWKIIRSEELGQSETCKGLFTYGTITPNSDTANHQELILKLCSYITKEELISLRMTLTLRNFIFSIPFFLFGIIFSFLYSRNSYLRTVAQSKVHVLGGLLPICSNCKKIRDDNGYWEQIESYISEHSEADFSHGLCPQCAKELYPDLDM